MTQPHHLNKHPKYRKRYKIQNWWSYEKSLINRGDLTLWLSEDVIESWNSDLNQKLGGKNLINEIIDIEFISSSLAFCCLLDNLFADFLLA